MACLQRLYRGATAAFQVLQSNLVWLQAACGQHRHDFRIVPAGAHPYNMNQAYRGLWHEIQPQVDCNQPATGQASRAGMPQTADWFHSFEAPLSSKLLWRWPHHSPSLFMRVSRSRIGQSSATHLPSRICRTTADSSAC